MSANVTAGIFALAGAILGVLGAVATQWRAGVVERHRLAHETTGRVNALAISVFREFLAAAKIVERLAELREANQVLSHDEIRAATDRMWLGWQEVSVFCRLPSIPHRLISPKHCSGWSGTNRTRQAYLNTSTKLVATCSTWRARSSGSRATKPGQGP